MIVEKFVLTAFQQNTRVVACPETRTAICIDPGERSNELESFIKGSELTLQAIALTHGHLDHIGGTLALHKAFPEAEILLHEGDEDLYNGLPMQPLMLGIEPHQLEALGLAYDDPPQITRNWRDGEIYAVGNLRFNVRHCPGHTRGHVILVEETEKVIFVGDCLFEGSIGRTDLPGGNYGQLIDSIRSKILSVGDEFTVYTGHGRETTTGCERATNPFLNFAREKGQGKYFET